jgi:hypothetical protein
VPEELKAMARIFVRESGEVGTGFRWIRSYVTEGAVVSECIAKDGAQVREHGERVGFGDVSSIVEVIAVIDPETAGDQLEDDQT